MNRREFLLGTGACAVSGIAGAGSAAAAGQT